MPPLTADIISALGGIILGLLAGVPTAYVLLRKLKPEVKTLDAQADESGARAVKVQAETWIMLIESYQELLNDTNKRIDEQDEKIRALMEQKVIDTREKEDLRRENQGLKERLSELEDNKIPAMDLEIRSLREQIIALGGKPKTGPLGRKGG